MRLVSGRYMYFITHKLQYAAILLTTPLYDAVSIVCKFADKVGPLSLIPSPPSQLLLLHILQAMTTVVEILNWE